MKKLTAVFVLAFVFVLCGFVSAQQTKEFKTYYKYDALNRLTNVVYDNGLEISYTYDAMGNRLSERMNTNRLKAKTPIVATTETARQKSAISKIQKLVLNHPEPLVREKLLELIKSGKVLFAANNVLPEMSSSCEQNNGKDQVLLWYNIDFLLDVPEIKISTDKEDYLTLCLYHEAVHIDDHFSGKYVLLPLISDKELKEPAAKSLWNMEWSAVTKEWELAKKMKKPYLVPVIYNATKEGESRKTFLQGFYQLQMTGNASALNPTLRAGFRSRYEAELAKLPSN